jgi:hypothetical protein
MTRRYGLLRDNASRAIDISCSNACVRFQSGLGLLLPLRSHYISVSILPSLVLPLCNLANLFCCSGTRFVSWTRKATGLEAGRCVADYLCSLWLRAAEEGIEESSSLRNVFALDPFKVLDFEAVLGNNLPMPTGILLECDTLCRLSRQLSFSNSSKSSYSSL